MGQNTVIALGLSRMGWSAKVEMEFKPSCVVCKKEIETIREFWYCKSQKTFWCYNDRAIKWSKHCMEDEHNHYCIRNLEVEKKEDIKNE